MNSAMPAQPRTRERTVHRTTTNTPNLPAHHQVNEDVGGVGRDRSGRPSAARRHSQLR